MSVNQALLDHQISHAIGLERLKSGVVRRILAFAAELDRDIEEQIAAALGRMEARGLLSAELRAAELQQLRSQLSALIQDIRGAHAAIYDKLSVRLRDQLGELSEYEIAFQQRIVGQAAGGVSFGFIPPTLTNVLTLVDSRPFQGAILKDWARDLSSQRLRRIERQLSIGFTESESIPQLMRRVRTDLRGLSRRHLETWVRSAVSHTAAEVSEATTQANKDLIEAIIWLATLDLRTTEECISRDQYRYHPETKKPLDGGPPYGAGPGRLHPRCRSRQTWQLVSWQKLKVDAKEVTPEFRRSMDGKVPAKTNYRQWAMRQPDKHLDIVIGPTRRQLIRKGQLSLEDLINPQRGDFWTLTELRDREAAAFRAISRSAA